MNENDLLYSRTHEWVHLNGEQCTLGISRFAVSQLTDLVYIELPELGKSLKAGEQFGVVESVKAVGELYSPVSGEVTAVNTDAANDPALLSQDPYDRGWLLQLKLSGPADKSQLLDKAAYDELTSKEH